MKRALFIFITLTPVFVMAQKNFSVKGIGNALKDGDKVYLVYKQQGKVIFDSTIVRSHIFKFKGFINDISIAQIYKNENPMVVDEPSDDLNFIIEKGNIKITVDKSLQEAVVTGTTNNIQYQQLNIALKPYNRKRSDLYNARHALTPEQQKDINNMANFRAADKKISDEMAPVQFKFIKEHPSSYISLVTLQQMLKSKVMLPEINSAYTKLSPDAQASVIGKEIALGMASAKKAGIGTMAYNFTLPDTNGKPVSLTDFKGKYVLVDFWASWCLPCREENPNIILTYNKFKARGFTVLGVSVENKNEKKNWLKAVKEDHLPWAQVLDGEKPQAKIKTIYGVSTIPSNVLIDPDGKIIAKDLKDKLLIDKLKEILGEPLVN